MSLVSYSDSEGSGDENPHQPPKATPSSTPAKADLQPVTDRSQPRKIKVTLTETLTEPPEQNSENGEPPAKRARVGPSNFSGFNAMLPPPKRTGAAASQTPTNKGAPRKVFSLKTGAEPGFDRSADEELRQLFGDQEQSTNGMSSAKESTQLSGGRQIETIVPTNGPTKKGNPMMFKPLSVARHPQKKKKQAASALTNISASQSTQSPSVETSSKDPIPAPKASLFSLRNDVENGQSEVEKSESYEPIVYHGEQGLEEIGADYDQESYDQEFVDAAVAVDPADGPPKQQSLNTIANDLNLSASAKRQLLGRSGSKSAANAVNVVNFNTDEEYAANESLRANGEQVQHNPVRAIAPGKHSLRQLVTAASGQRDALEESFAAGRRNKKEAGSKYGW